LCLQLLEWNHLLWITNLFQLVFGQSWHHESIAIIHYRILLLCRRSLAKHLPFHSQYLRPLLLYPKDPVYYWRILQKRLQDPRYL
jgi:hypothetical protein